MTVTGGKTLHDENAERGYGETRAPGPVTARAAVRIFGVSFSPLTYQEAVSAIRQMIKTRGCHHVVLANANTMNLAYTDARYRQVLKAAALTLRDGIGVELAALALGARLSHNFVGTDFVPDLLDDLQDLGISVFLYGAAPGVAEEAANVLKQRSPRVRVLGTAHGHGDREFTVERIRDVRPDILLVALGNPLQEQWIAVNLARLNARVAIGVGALFDYLAARIPRAPRWLRRIRCEWIFRLCTEPRRLWRRYVIGNPLFLWRLATTLGKKPT